MFKKLIWVALGVLLLVPLVWAGTVAQNSSEGVPGFGLMFQNPPNDNYPLYAQRFGFAFGSCAYYLARQKPSGDYFTGLNAVKACDADRDTVPFSFIKREHPEWLMKYKNGPYVADGGYYMLDIGNPQCVNYLISWISSKVSGTSLNIGLDNGMFQNADPKWAKYNTNASYQDAWKYFLSRLSAAFRPKYKIILNVGDCDLTTFQTMMSFVDGALFESMGRTTSHLAWIQDNMAKGKWLTDNGKIWCERLCVDTNTEADFLFGYAVMAMVGGPKSYFDLKNNSTTFYFPQMDYDMGKPLGAMKQLAPNVYERDFQNYAVYLNLSGSSYKLPDGSSLTSMGGAIKAYK